MAQAPNPFASPSQPNDWDLTTPVLSASDDVDIPQVEPGRGPWRPRTLWILTFFLTFAGLLLYYVNYKRLRLQGREIRAVVAMIIFLAVTVAGTAYMFRFGYTSDDNQRMFRLGLRIFVTGLAALLSRDQAARYRLYRASGVEPGKLLWPAIIALLISAVIITPLVLATGYVATSL